MNNPKEVKVYYNDNLSTKCCEDLRCVTADCDNTPKEGYVLCSECLTQKKQEKRKRIIEKAETVNDYDGPCFDCDGNFYQNVEHWRCDHEEKEDCEWLFIAKKILVFGELSVDAVIDPYLEDASIEDLNQLPSIQGQAELSEALTKFKKQNEDCCYYELDHDQKFRP